MWSPWAPTLTILALGLDRQQINHAQGMILKIKTAAATIPGISILFYYCYLTQFLLENISIHRLFTPKKIPPCLGAGSSHYTLDYKRASWSAKWYKDPDTMAQASV